MNGSQTDDFVLICDLRSQIPLDIKPVTLKYIRFSVLSNKYKIFYDGGCNLVGYIIWASVNEETILRLKRVSLFPLYPYEWREGKCTLILDIAFLPNCKLKVMRKELTKFISKQNIIYYVKRDKLVTKRIN